MSALTFGCRKLPVHRRRLAKCRHDGVGEQLELALSRFGVRIVEDGAQLGYAGVDVSVQALADLVWRANQAAFEDLAGRGRPAELGSLSGGRWRHGCRMDCPSLVF